MIATLALCAVVLAAEPAAVGSTGPASPGSDARPFHEIHAEITELLRSEAAAAEAAEAGEHFRILRRMCALHGEIVSDPRYSMSDTLAAYRTKLWSRLRRVQTDLKRELAKDEPRKSRQQGEPIAASANPLSLVAAESLSESLALLGEAQGGPGFLVALGGRAGPADHGPELVDLIERTINPAFWDTNGGPGSIYYYAPLHCLVVRATSEVHAKLGATVEGLRAAGR
jgi:hypothetical protein